MARGNHRWAGATLVTAALVHGVVFLLWQGGGLSLQTSDGFAPAPAAHAEGRLPGAPLSVVSLVDLPLAEAPQTVAGAGEAWPEEPGLASPSVAVAPGRQTGHRAPGAAGETASTQRSDATLLSKGLWNHPNDTQAQHANRARPGTTSPEALERSPSPRYSNRQVARHKVRLGAEEEKAGHEAGSGEGGVPGLDGSEWYSPEPRFDSAPGQSEQRVVGVANPNRESPRQDRGEASTENFERGKTTQWANAAELSNRKRSSPFDLGAPSAGGKSGLGAAGKAGQSVVSQGGQGRAAQNGSEAGAKSGTGPTHANRVNPYFYAMYRRIDKQLKFPRKLALNLEQGEVVLRFSLDARGRVHGLKVDKPSEFREFDSEALRAFRAAGPFGPVPRALLAGRSRVHVIAPYYFRNPLIR